MENLDHLIKEYKKLFAQDLDLMDNKAFIEQQKKIEELGKKILSMNPEILDMEKRNSL
jgi:hypothetical protein